MMAMRELQQIAELVSIKATETDIAFADARGQRSYMLDGKGVKIVAAGTDVSVKSRWDKAIVKQEFSTDVEQADTDLERRRERTPGHDGQGREPAPANARAEGRVRPKNDTLNRVVRNVRNRASGGRIQGLP